MADVIRIETPDALTGFLLVQKLEALGAEVRAVDPDRWEVQLPAARAAQRLDEVIAAVQRWLDEERIPSATVDADAERRVLSGRVVR